MKFSTSKLELQKALQKLSKATPTRTTLPILGCVLIESAEEKTTFKTTDLEITIQVVVPSSLEEPGSAAVPLKTLLEIANELPDIRLTITVNNKNRVSIKTDLGEYDIMARPAEEFPSTPKQEDIAELKTSGKILKEVVDATAFAVSRDELKPALTGVLMQISQEKITAVSTDGHRLVKYVRNDFKSEGFSGEIVVPKKFLLYLSGQLQNQDVVLSIGESHLTAKFDKDVVLTRVISEKFPDYQSVIPKDNNKKLLVEKEVLLGAIRRVSIFSNKATHQVALSLENGSIKIKTEDPEKSSKGEESISAKFEGDPITIGYNAEYLKDIVGHVQGEVVKVELGTPVSAALFNSQNQNEDFESLMLLMPIRLND